jgi:O-antigen/teichoic acid export membrane protein
MAKSPEGNITSAISYQYLSSVAFVAFGGVFYIFIAKFLPTSEVGAVSLVLATTSLLNIIFSLSLSTSAQHFISYNLGEGDQAEMNSLARRLVLISLLLSFVSIIFTLLTARPLAVLFFHNASYSVLIETASVYVAVMIMFGVLHGSALGFQLFRTDAIVFLSSASFSYLIGLVFLVIFHSLIYLIIGLTLSYLYGSIIYVIIIFLRRQLSKERSRKTTLQLILAYSWPLILAQFIGYGSQYVDRFVVAYFLSISTLGIYSLVLIVSQSLSFLSTPLVNILVPKLSEYFSLTDNERLRRGVNLSSVFIMMISSPLSLGVASVAPIALSLLARYEYSSGYVALIILLGVSSLFILGSVMSSVITAVKKTRVYIVSTSLTLISNVLLSFILIPRIGMIGAAVANSSVLVISFIVMYYYAIVKGIGGFDWVTVMKLWSASLIMFSLVTLERIYLGNYINLLPLYIVTGALFYIIALNTIRSLKRLKKDEFFSYIPIRLGLRKIATVLLWRAF